MPTYIVLGATGQVRGSIIQILLTSKDNKIRPFVRSKWKLLTQRPELESFSNVTIHEDQLTETARLAEVLMGSHVAFLAVGAVDNIPHCDVAMQQAKGVVAALERLRQKDASTRLPQLVILSSATLEKDLMKDFPVIGFFLLERALGWIYRDLRAAEDYLRSHEWIRQVYVKPGGLVQGEPVGHKLSTERQQTFLSYMDLAGGMVEIAEADDDRWDLQNVSVIPVVPCKKVEWRISYFFVKGLVYFYLPWTHPYLSPYLY